MVHDQADQAVKLNRLAREKSPYLRQHATNPVDWYPWGQEALDKAKREQKPIFLSIGYSSCHWCHVMEDESFSDEEVAAVLNEHFVAIKVDREERPDVDEIYMLAAQLMTGAGGWPLSVWLTPELEPFFAGTYFPRDSKWGRPGFLDILGRIKDLWNDPQTREELVTNSRQISQRLQVIYEGAGAEAIGRKEIENAVDAVSSSVDEVHGGFGDQPKFPSPSSVELLLRAGLEPGGEGHLGQVRKTLDHMLRGGIHDHVGGGFHRYSTTRDWRVPHFEKMLYDNAQLLALYSWAYLVTGDKAYAATSRDIARWVVREMTHEQGGFYSAQDADDPGGPEGEGGFYTWDSGEIGELFRKEEAEVVSLWFSIGEGGNWEHRPGRTILERKLTLADVAGKTGLEPARIETILEDAVERMYEVREARPKPLTDTKVLSGWNGLMITGFAKAYQALGDREFLDAAVAAGNFLRENLTREGRLLRRWMDGDAAHDGVLADYAYVVAAYLDLYESTFDEEWLREALRLNELAIDLFHDTDRGGFYFTARDGEKLIARGKPGTDNARPSGNAVMALNLLRIAELSGDEKARDLGMGTLACFGGSITRYALGAGAMLNAAAFAHAGPREIFIAGERDDPATRALIEAVWRDPDPNRVLALVTPGIEKLLPPAQGKTPVDGKPAAYVCRNFTCDAPVTDPAALRR